MSESVPTNPESLRDPVDLHKFLDLIRDFWKDLDYEDFDVQHERRSVELEEYTVVNDFFTADIKSGKGIAGADRHFVYPRKPIHAGDPIRPLFEIHENYPPEGGEYAWLQAPLHVWYRPDPESPQLQLVDADNYQDALIKFKELGLEV
jgi:hypothetical protein